MKTLLGMMVFVAGTWAAPAQTNTICVPLPQGQATRKKIDQPIAETLRPQFTDRIRRPSARYGGFLVDVARSPDTFTMVNPFRPTSPDAGMENVFYDDRTGRARGIALLSIRF